MKGKHDNHIKGKEHYRWNDKPMVSSHGYIKVRVGREHPLADPNGYAYEHLLVWVQAGNPRPGKNMVLHHKNHDKKDNRIENLQIASRTEHAAEHQPMLSDEDIRQIRTAYDQGALGTSLAEEYGIPTGSVYKIIKGERRADAGGPIATGNLRKAKELKRVHKS